MFETPITDDVQDKLREQMDNILMTLPDDLRAILRQT